MPIIRQPLFDDLERKEIGQDLGVLKRLAAAEIAKHPEKREEILQKLAGVSRQYVADRAHHQRKVIFGAALTISVVGFILVWLGDSIGVRLVMAFGGFAAVSGIVTALLNIPIRRS